MSKPSKAGRYDGSCLSIKVEVTAGTMIHRAIQDGIALAQRMRCIVSFNFNGQMVFCRSDSTPESLVKVWDSNMKNIRRATNGTKKKIQGHQS